MHRLIFWLPLAVLAGIVTNDPAQAQPYQPYGQPYGAPQPYYPPPPSYAPPPYYVPQAPPPGYGEPPPGVVYYPAPSPTYAGPPARSVGPAYSPENCGTPDEVKPCPPRPRVPLPYYPANR